MAKHKSFTVGYEDIERLLHDPRAPGSEAPTKIPTACYDSTSPEKPTCPATPKPISTKVASRLNQRPRKTLGFQTPASKLQASVA